MVEEWAVVDDETIRARVSWTDPDGIERRRVLDVRPSQVEDGRVPLWLPEDDPRVLLGS